MPIRPSTILGVLLALLALSPALAQENSVVVASTTSLQDSGLFGHILPMFKAKTGIDARVMALGTGQALDTGRRGDADVVFVHAKAEEEKFVADGFGVKRYPVMYNDFVLNRPEERYDRHQGHGRRRGGVSCHRGEVSSIHLAR
jgi:tungstate transport system substrate-binding protein